MSIVKKEMDTMSKKVFKISGTVFAILTFTVLFFPWIHGYCEAYTTTGFGFTTISVWGRIIFILPIMILGLTFSKLSEKTKTIFLLGLYLLGGVSFYYTASIGIEWFRGIAEGYVRPNGLLFLYPVFMFLSLLLFYLSYNTKNCSLLNLIGIEVCDKVDEDIGELYLCSRPYTFGRFRKGEGLNRFPGCISFITEDGYFSALGHDENYSYLKEGCIEIFDGDDTTGFVMQMRTSGVYGSFYDGQKFSKDTKMRIAPFSSIESGKAELWLPSESGFVKQQVEIKPNSPVYITCKLSSSKKNSTSIDGAVIVQNGKAIAVVSEYDAENDVYNCISASRVTVPLIYMAQEQKVLEKTSIA